ncbi:efflux RND transporter periplasmic adaptor subunit [uncultured Amnibacterium sp.]|uniref:efflux RND transporter periplasmic adaptor subunit n=1 Tax=uncultured Amnibacterium sp. TaxID=1631851 RepID=UPI0035CABA93
MAGASQARRRRRRIIVGVVIAVVVVALVGAGVLLRPTRSSASSYLTSTVQRADVASTVAASGSLVDQYTYSVAAGETPVLTELAGIATGASGSSTTSTSSTSGSGGSGASTSGASASGTAASGAASGSSSSSGGSGGYTTRSIAVTLGEKVAKDAKIAVARDSDGTDHTVKAPVAGHVRSLTTAVGASASSVATIGAGSALVSIDVDENRIGAVRADQTVALTLGSGGATFTGTVRQIAQLPDGSSGVQQYQVLVTPDSIPTGSRIGMTVTASIEIDSRQDVLTVPAGAVTTSQGRPAVRVLDAKGALHTVRVETGLVGDSAVEIVDGLTVGQRVVTGGTGTVPAASTVQRPPAG